MRIRFAPKAAVMYSRKGKPWADVQLARGLTWHTLESANPSADLTQLSAGQEICVPQENVPCELPRTITLGAEETLETVALKYNLSMARCSGPIPAWPRQTLRKAFALLCPNK